ncbi:MAG: hypothetical protein AAGG44_01770 [Planctomycetota bacterium]
MQLDRETIIGTLLDDMMNAGVLIHGCNLWAENWRHIAWGDPPVAMGRLPQGLLTAYINDAKVIVLGSGASSKEFRGAHSPKHGQELLESEYTYEYLLSHFDSLLNFKPWQDYVPESRDAASWQALKEKMLSRIVLDTVSQNTVEELATAGHTFVEEGVERVFLVSSPTHVVRVLRDSNKVFQSDYQFRQFMYSVNAVPCVTCYEGSTPSDVVVIEPPHRPDRHVLPTHRRIQRMLGLQKLDPSDLLDFINDFDELLQHYEELYFVGRLGNPMPGSIELAPTPPKTASVPPSPANTGDVPISHTVPTDADSSAAPAEATPLVPQPVL